MIRGAIRGIVNGYGKAKALRTGALGVNTAILDPTCPEAQEDVRVLIGCNVVYVVWKPQSIASCITQCAQVYMYGEPLGYDNGHLEQLTVRVSSKRPFSVMPNLW